MRGPFALSDAMRSAWTRARRRPRRVGSREAEELLTGAPVAADRRALAELLSAAAGPTRPDELHGVQAPLAVFEQSHRPPEMSHRRRRRTVFARLGIGWPTAKLAAVAILAVVGTVTAAKTGVLPDSAQQVAHDMLGGVGVPAPVTASPRNSPGTQGDPGRPTASPTPPAVRQNQDDDAEALCRAYRDRRRSPDPQVSLRLARLAGGAPKVDRFCTGVLDNNDDQPSTDPSSHPAKSPSSRPSMTRQGDPQDQPVPPVSRSE